MSVISVRARSFILALFIRDDGERFLLGDKGFDFKDSQLHFSANTIENDEVAKQGVDGVMLAGQVRRASVQSFDGYVGDATTLKEEVEQMRRDFIAFFAKGHHFRVIYIDCNRNAWQRKGGYLVDAPEVKELWQIHPEYHVGLNFEDVNYYEYDENAEGEEILSNIISVPISSDVEGGLVWDENGAVSEDATVVYDGDTATASGKSISVSDAVEAPLKSLEIQGNTSQQTYTGKNLFKPSVVADGTVSGVTFSHSTDGSLVNITTGSGSSSAAVDRMTHISLSDTPSNLIESGSTYTLSTTTPLPNGVRVAVLAYSATSWLADLVLLQGNGSRTSSSAVVTIPSTATRIRWGVHIDSGISLNLQNLGIQFEKNSSATSFEPYVGGTASPNPDYPQAVQTVTGENVVKISDGQGNEQSYEVNLGNIELCKIGTYQDYIYKNLTDNKWYVHKEVGKAVLDGSENWWESGVQTGNVYQVATGGYAGVPVSAGYSDSLEIITTTAWYAERLPNKAIFTSNNIYVRVSLSLASTLEQFKAWLASNPITVYYPLATPTDTEITNEALIAQLEAILSQGYTYAGTNNITTVISAGNAQGELEITYYTKYDAKVVGGGYVWEAGGSGGPTVVTNESISAVSPVWTVFGPALNPMLENTTTGEQIQYVGMISEGQTLVVDMGEQTARLDGLNVISNIVGEYLTLAPGSNTLLFSAEGDAPASEIGWSEIVG